MVFHITTLLMFSLDLPNLLWKDNKNPKVTFLSNII